MQLQIPQRVSPGRQNIAFHIHPEGQYHVHNNRRAQGEKGDVHEPHADAGSGNAQPLANGSANAKSLPFYKIFKPLHGANLDFFVKTLLISTAFLNAVLSNFAPLFKTGIEQFLHCTYFKISDYAF
jgi:hypothetical protein